MSTPTREESERALARAMRHSPNGQFVSGCALFLAERGHLTEAQIRALGKVSDAMTLRPIQNAVVASMNPRQRQTTSRQQAEFLLTEASEILKEFLKLDGVYGEQAQAEAPDNITKELCDVIWNAFALAHRLGIEDLTPHMVSMLDRNASRSWPGDPLATPEIKE